MEYLKLLRPKDWAKNLFLFLPLFFGRRFNEVDALLRVALGFVAFCFVASSIYIINDYRDREDDRKHPVKCRRPLASGAVSPRSALLICAILILAGFAISLGIREKFAVVLGIYFLINLGYSLGLKAVPILDLMLLAAGFVLRIKGGSVISLVPLSEWIVIMVFLLAIFMAIGKRRDDVLLKLTTGADMRKSIKGYNLDLLNILLALVSAIIIVAYLMYCMDPATITNMGTYRLYYTGVFVMAGIMRYLQIIYVSADAGSPTKILYKDRFIQFTLLLWIASFIVILYLKNEHLFK
ncbi:MAG TPA: decaprenyl-phosphate phosphoribosyltransferase [Puia sp.]|nr:decaprenyl-phosphate phosphoribosyltransferase [Puia sp.]